MSWSGLPETAMMSANLPFSIEPTSALPAVVQHPRRRQIRRLQRLRRRHSPFDVDGELIGLLAVRNARRRRAAAEHDRHTGAERLPERLLHQPHARVPPVRRMHVLRLRARSDRRAWRRAAALFAAITHAGVVELEQMIGRIDAGVEAACHALAAVGVARDLQAEPVRFVDDGLDFLEGERRELTSFASGPTCASARRNPGSCRS